MLLGEQATQAADGTVRLSNGETLQADIVYRATGIKPNTAFLEPLEILNEKGFIKVRFTDRRLTEMCMAAFTCLRTRPPAAVIECALPAQVTDKLQVQGLQNVFAVGDARDVKEVKLGYLARAQASTHHACPGFEHCGTTCWVPQSWSSITFGTLCAGSAGC